MAGFTGIKDVVDAQNNGQYRDCWFRKTPSQSTSAGFWFDLATVPGNPKAKNWFDSAPLTAVQVKQSTDGGIYHGAAVSPQQMYLRKSLVHISVATPTPMKMILCDYLLYYPTIDDSETAQQDMVNSVTLPRYTDGKGVQMMAVTLAARTGGQTFTVNYTNSNGVSGRTSQTVTQSAQAIVGSLTGSIAAPFQAQAPFIGLQAGDSGVRSVESVQMNGADTGLFAIVLVKPLAETQLTGLTQVETDYLMNKSEMPRIYDDAFLNYICLPNGALSALVIHGNLKTVYN